MTAADAAQDAQWKRWRAVADALTTMGIEHSPRCDIVGTGCVAFRDPDGIEWEFRIR